MKKEHHNNDYAFDVTRSALVCGNLGRKTMLGDCDCASLQFSQNGHAFCIAVGFVGAGFASSILRLLGRGIPAFCSSANEEANLGAFCTLQYSEGRNSRNVFRGFGRVIRAAWSGRCGL